MTDQNVFVGQPNGSSAYHSEMPTPSAQAQCWHGPSLRVALLLAGSIHPDTGVFSAPIFGTDESSIPLHLYEGTRTSIPHAGYSLMALESQQLWLTASEAAQYLKVKARTLLMWARQGKLKDYVLSGTRRRVWRFQHVDLDAMLTEPSVALTSKRRMQ